MFGTPTTPNDVAIALLWLLAFSLTTAAGITVFIFTTGDRSTNNDDNVQ